MEKSFDANQFSKDLVAAVVRYCVCIPPPGMPRTLFEYSSGSRDSDDEQTSTYPSSFDSSSSSSSSSSSNNEHCESSGFFAIGINGSRLQELLGTNRAAYTALMRRVWNKYSSDFCEIFSDVGNHGIPDSLPMFIINHSRNSHCVPAALLPLVICCTTATVETTKPLAQHFPAWSAELKMLATELATRIRQLSPSTSNKYCEALAYIAKLSCNTTPPPSLVGESDNERVLSGWPFENTTAAPDASIAVVTKRQPVKRKLQYDDIPNAAAAATAVTKRDVSPKTKRQQLSISPENSYVTPPSSQPLSPASTPPRDMPRTVSLESIRYRYSGHEQIVSASAAVSITQSVAPNTFFSKRPIITPWIGRPDNRTLHSLLDTCAQQNNPCVLLRCRQLPRSVRDLILRYRRLFNDLEFYVDEHADPSKPSPSECAFPDAAATRDDDSMTG
jgi:hypothetical protein